MTHGSAAQPAGAPEVGEVDDFAVLRARCAALRVPLPLTAVGPCNARASRVSLDAFAAESLCFFSRVDAVESAVARERPSVKRPPERAARPAEDARAKGAKRQKRFVSNWTPEMDKILRKSLSKFGWGCWARIAASGKLPKEYTAKMIANRAKSIGLNKNMFRPAIAYSRTKPHNR
ncbi:Homeobox-like protein [Gracilaria domingensis]|nr:Homeobox-like protein [Gracilaria domingensis]